MGRKREAVIWRPIDGFDMYEASSEGMVRSWNGGRWGRRKQPHVLAAHVDRYGYLTVMLGRGKRVAVHRVVCAAFHGAKPEGKEAAHCDGNPLNNRPSNLAWKTPVENAADRLLHGTHTRGVRNGAAKLTESQVRQILVERASGGRNKDIAKKFNISPQAVSSITKGKKWAYLGGV